jgi:hypothetical protein
MKVSSVGNAVTSITSSGVSYCVPFTIWEQYSNKFNLYSYNYIYIHGYYSITSYQSLLILWGKKKNPISSVSLSAPVCLQDSFWILKSYSKKISLCFWSNES